MLDGFPGDEDGGFTACVALCWSANCISLFRYRWPLGLGLSSGGVWFTVIDCTLSPQLDLGLLPVFARVRDRIQSHLLAGDSRNLPFVLLALARFQISNRDVRLVFRVVLGMREFLGELLVERVQFGRV